MNKKRILIVEDNNDLAEMYRLAFSQEFEVDIATKATEGVSKAVSFKPDLILLDILLGLEVAVPAIDGLDVLKKIRGIVPIETIIVINSNLSQEKTEEKAKQLGANAFFRKSDHTPFEIVDKVKEMLK